VPSSSVSLWRVVVVVVEDEDGAVDDWKLSSCSPPVV
jgi:hypothetical protein